MRLRELAEGFSELEATGSRLRSVEVLAELLRRATKEELEAVVWLLQGQLRPSYEGVEVGVGEKLLVGILAEAYGASEAVVTRRFRQVGDLGLVAESLAPATSRASLTVRGAHDELLAAARMVGPGSTARKSELLTRVLRGTGGTAAKYLVRVIQGRLRLGVGDQTILEATALAALGDRGKKAVVEHAYNVRSDLAGVVRIAFAEGEGALKKIGPEVGIPVRPALAQRLASAAAVIERLGTVQAEPKYDGFRLQLHKRGDRVWAFSRRLENVTEMFPDLAEGVRRQLTARSAIIEGEAVGYDPETGEFLPFQVTMKRKRKQRIAETAESHPVRLFAFDVLYASGRSYLTRPLSERSRALRTLLPFRPTDPIVVTDAMTTDRPEALQAYFDRMIGRGLEGVMAKRPDAPYQAGGRGYDWVKLKRSYESKLRDTVDVVLVGYMLGRGKRAALGIGSLLAAVYDPRGDRFRTVAKIGSGLSEDAWKNLRSMLDEEAVERRPPRVDSLIVADVWTEPKYVVTVLADEITRSPFHTCGRRGDEPGYALRFPRVLDGVRSDKAATDATTEREILDLHRLQRAVGAGAGAGER